MSADDAVNYGAIGAVIGHEIGHGFDDSGSTFDGDGVLRNWWTDEDKVEFEKRTARLVGQYGEFQPFDDLNVNGEFTLGENIGDLGGLSIALLLLGVKFFQEALHTLPLVLELKEADLVLVTLSLVDMALVGGLLVMVMLSGYENFVSQIDIEEGKEKLSWLGKLDSGSLKQKVAASIVAISSIHLLKAFMNAQQIPDNKLMWYVIIHLTFVLSALGMAFVDNMNKH
jgi:uncharacterized protein (TIGR00645 family)